MVPDRRAASGNCRAAISGRRACPSSRRAATCCLASEPPLPRPRHSPDRPSHAFPAPAKAVGSLCEGHDSPHYQAVLSDRSSTQLSRGVKPEMYGQGGVLADSDQLSVVCHARRLCDLLYPGVGWGVCMLLPIERFLLSFSAFSLRPRGDSCLFRARALALVRQPRHRLQKAAHGSGNKRHPADGDASATSSGRCCSASARTDRAYANGRQKVGGGSPCTSDGAAALGDIARGYRGWAGRYPTAASHPCTPPPRQ